ncbi:HWE histidine kinase domain-containing protein [Rhizobium rosettiformans]|uniref:histidine kinase n=1 Tax=Rhizobium rosettiformans W3 TaxID=538378 RepID=A0A4S8Q9D5_9HYPH|nr:HWE histidine kinase domain-containing protein [Rhizobium rosettiformans]THV39325.1 GAF domain-containing protein [Rhizobium rosettiformans W3]
MQTAPSVDLTNCDREPIHIPGSIQPHGCLLACDQAVTTVRFFSANAPEMLGAPGIVQGSYVTEFLGDEVIHDIRNAIAAAPEANRAAVIAHLRLPNGKYFDVAVHRQKQGAIIEFEPSLRRTQPLQLAREMIGRIKDINDVDLLISASAKLVRTVLGYDRVMIYRFEEDGSGRVASEAKREDLESFLGQYFPATDIPQQARILYMQNPIRVISDARGLRVNLEPELEEREAPLDLSFAHLRSVSPIHCEYLRNMGVSASMSISLILDNRLWGLIACHHYAPKTLTMSERIAAEMFGEFFSLHLLALKQKRKLDVANEARRSLDRFLQAASLHTDLDDILTAALPEFQALFACDGVGLWINGRWTSIGSTPPKGAEDELIRFISSVADGRIWSTKRLSEDYPPASAYFEDVSGVMAVPLSQLPRDYLFFFRKERLQTLDWAGNPEKTYETGPLGDRLTPRKSFALWKETVQRQATPWRDSDFEIAEAIRSATVEIVLRHNELMQEERSKSDVRQRMLNEELNHRVKNILAVIKSLIAAPSQDEVPIDTYIGSLRGRVQALSHAHDQLTRGGGGGTLHDLLEAELLPYRASQSSIEIHGAPVTLDARAHAVAALVIHELCTNAAKYGALSRDGGALNVAWEEVDDGDCILRWRESGGPVVGPVGRKGFGTALIERSIPYDLGGTSNLDYRPDGLNAEFRLPGRFLTWEDEPAAVEPTVAANLTPEAALTSLAGLPVLLVEDQVLIAMDAEMMLADAGMDNVVTASSSTDALNRLKTFTPSIAILDINLGRDTSVPVAEELLRRGIPFVFATGYDDRSVVPDELLSIPVVRKPYDSNALMKALSDRLTASTAAQ